MDWLQCPTRYQYTSMETCQRVDTGTGIYADTTHLPPSYSCGEVVPGGELGSVTPDDTGRATLHTTSATLKVWDLIGRSVVVYCVQEDGSSEW